MVKACPGGKIRSKGVGRGLGTGKGKGPLKFYDLRGKKSFSTSAYKTQVRKGRRFAVAKAPSGSPAWRILGKK